MGRASLCYMPAKLRPAASILDDTVERKQKYREDAYLPGEDGPQVYRRPHVRLELATPRIAAPGLPVAGKVQLRVLAERCEVKSVVVVVEAFAVAEWGGGGSRSPTRGLVVGRTTLVGRDPSLDFSRSVIGRTCRAIAFHMCCGAQAPTCVVVWCCVGVVRCRVQHQSETHVET